jgi:hypothetical protein
LSLLTYTQSPTVPIHFILPPKWNLQLLHNTKYDALLKKINSQSRPDRKYWNLTTAVLQILYVPVFVCSWVNGMHHCTIYHTEQNASLQSFPMFLQFVNHMDWRIYDSWHNLSEVEVTLRLTVSQSVSMSWYRAPLWDLQPDIISCRNVVVWNLQSCNNSYVVCCICHIWSNMNLSLLPYWKKKK